MCSGDEDRTEDTAHEPEVQPVIEEVAVGDGKRKLRYAVAGCSHGEMDAIYETLAEIEKEKGYKFDLLICCGDYQSVRNYGDLAHMHVPDKYKELRTFYKYYSGQSVAPILTIFIGGNHEASGYLCELPYGGWVAPRIYYMGFSGVVRFAGLRIAGLSGIFKGFDYNRGHHERPPFNESTKVSVYHTREIDVWRLRHLRPADDDKTSNAVDILLSHDWPSGISAFGDEKKLLRIKPYFNEDIAKGKLGNPGTMKLLEYLRPRFYFAAHLHVMFPALVPHRGDDEGRRPEPTRFLALDKPIPRRQFVQALEIEIADDANTTNLFYDPEWLAVLKSTDKFTSISEQKQFFPSNHSQERCDFRPTAEELAAVIELGDLKIPENFQHTATPIFNESEGIGSPASLYYRNPQTTKFCEWIGITDLNKLLADKNPDLGIPHYLTQGGDAADPQEIRLDDEIFGEEDFVIDTRPSAAPSTTAAAAESNEVASFLDNFQAPSWKGASSSATDDSGEVALKRRKVDINEDE